MQIATAKYYILKLLGDMTIYKLLLGSKKLLVFIHTCLQQGLLQQIHYKTLFGLIFFLFYFDTVISCFRFIFFITFSFYSLAIAPLLFPSPTVPHTIPPTRPISKGMVPTPC